MKIATFTEKLDINYKYMKLPTGEADVFIYNFVEEKQKEDGIEYIYEFNEFRTSEITEEEIKSNPLTYLNYNTRKVTDAEKIEELEKKVIELETQVKALKQQN